MLKKFTQKNYFTLNVVNNNRILCLVLLLLCSFKYAYTQGRSCDPVVLIGADVPCLIDESPSEIVAFKFNTSLAWEQVPIQIDERLILDIATPYGGANCLPTTGANSDTEWDVLFYADTTTFIGADTSVSFDHDDELVFMAKDLGSKSTEMSSPDGVSNQMPCEITIYDSLDNVIIGYLYLFIQDGSLRQDADTSYVDYDFLFYPEGDAVQGTTVKTDYIPCYNNLMYNTENSFAITDRYEVGFSSRWKEEILKIKAGSASGVDVLDLHQGTLSTSECIRNTTTYTLNRGIVVNAINRPIRAIRSVMGTNSGVSNQLTYFFTQCRVAYINDYRVHSNETGISDIFDIFDLNEEMIGSTYSNEVNQSPISIDGNQDVLNIEDFPSWAFYKGSAGSIAITHKLETNMTLGATREEVQNDLVEASSSSYYDDGGNPAIFTCTGDEKAYGASGVVFETKQCTDRRYDSPACAETISNPKELTLIRVHYYLPPEATQSEAIRYSDFVYHPLNGFMSDSAFMSGSALPVELINFKTLEKEDHIALNWTTASEIDFSHYEIERSLDAKQFNTVHKILARQQLDQQNYYFEDHTVKEGISYYYRLKMVDQDGSFSYSSIRTAKLNAQKWKAQVLPNPSTGDQSLKIYSDGQQEWKLDIYRLDGTHIASRYLELNKGLNWIPFQIHNRTPSTYILFIRNSSGEIKQQLMLLIN